MVTRNIAAIDLGASSGRVMLSQWRSDEQRLSLKEVHRFENKLVRVAGPDQEHDTWDLDAIEREIRTGLALIDVEGIVLDSIGIDSWGVDYVLLNARGERVGLPYSYRDHRTDGVMAELVAHLGRENLYQRTGIQFLPFNTLYQLAAFCRQEPDLLSEVAHFVMIPDYFHFKLTGEMNCEYTNASTTQLLNLEARTWDAQLLDEIGVPIDWFKPLSQPGKRVGHWVSSAGRHVPVTAVATHDTASAVIAAPLMLRDSLYLSSGTWSLMGMETKKPLNGPQALAANVTNEGGINGTYRVLKNIMGLWLLQSVCRESQVSDLPALINRVASVPAFVRLINPNDERFINPPSMSDEIRSACRENGQLVPETIEEIARCIFDSLAMLYRQVSLELAELHGRSFELLHIIGGGSRNKLLNQLSADVCELPVMAGPEEASALGNVGCQLMALNDIDDLKHFRSLLAESFPLTRYEPNSLPNINEHWQRFQSLCSTKKDASL